MKYNVVVINADGEIIGISEYDETADDGRDGRVQAAVNKLAGELGIQRPGKPLRNRSIVAGDGNEWGKMSALVQVGMVEVGFGKWGFSKPA